MSRRRAPRWLPALAIDAPSAQIVNGLIGLLEDQRLQHSPCAPTVFMLQPARTRSLAKALEWIRRRCDLVSEIIIIIIIIKR